ncbi:MAG: TIGR03546 family protein [Planctomycetaceae bacterium]|nr:TIGR03546 family protein [Planctomycetaceae bacterium]
MLLKPLRMAAQAFALKMSPRRMAAGLALGTAVGMVPKGNLTSVVLMTLLCALRINLAAGLFAVFVVSIIASFADPLFHEIGHALLTAESFQETWTWFFNRPLAAWTDLNNTVVMGSLIVGLASIYPVYRGCRPICERYVPVISEKVRKWKIVMWLAGASVTDRMSAASE